ncbi:MAG: hypothetical protein AAGF99_07045 [Bacteroidota bacterium]
MPVLLATLALLLAAGPGTEVHRTEGHDPVPTRPVIVGVSLDGQAPPDSTQRPPVAWQLTPELNALYSPRRGFGLGANLTAHHLGWSGSRWRAGTILAQRYQRLALSVYSASPYQSRVHGMFGLYARTTTERPFFGAGGRTSDTLSVRFQHTTLDAEALLGAYAFDHTGLLVQPFVRVRWDRIGRITEAADQLPLLDAASQGSVAAAQVESRTGAYVGVSFASDTRDAAEYARQGWLAQVSGSRYLALDGSDLGFWQGSATVYGFLPIADLVPALRHHVVQLSAHVATRRGVTVEALPFYYLAVLDYRMLGAYGRYRLTGLDAFVTSATYRFPVPSLFDLVTDALATDAFVGVQLGNVYNRIEDEFSARVSFTSDFEGDGRVPLRPVFVLGGSLLDRARSDLILTAQFSLGTERAFASEIRLVYDLRRFRSPLR